MGYLLVANPPCGVETSNKVSFSPHPFVVANPPCGVETRSILSFGHTPLVANPPCGVETNNSALVGTDALPTYIRFKPTVRDGDFNDLMLIVSPSHVLSPP